MQYLLISYCEYRTIPIATDDLKKCEVTLLPSADKRQCGLVVTGGGMLFTGDRNSSFKPWFYYLLAL